MKIVQGLPVAVLAVGGLLCSVATAQNRGTSTGNLVYVNAYQGGYYNNGSRLNAHDQNVYDQLYNNYLNAQRINDRGQVRKAESAMQKVYQKYNIPSNTPYGAVASSGGYNQGYNNGGYNNGGYNNGGYNNGGYNNGGYNNGYGSNYAGRLNAHDQSVYDRLYANWLQAKSINDRSQMQKAETAMQNVMRQYNVPTNTPYSALASQ